MNKQSPIYKALEARSEGRQLPSDLTSHLMCEIRVAECHRKRRELWWGIAGYSFAALIAIATVVYFCGDIFIRLGKDMSASFSAINASVSITIVILVSASAVLLTLDYILRRKFALKQASQSTL